MDYLITFDDGSEALMHYGVKGMKWRKHKAKDFIDEQIIPEQTIPEQIIPEQIISEKTVAKKKAGPLSVLRSGLSGVGKFASARASDVGAAVENGKKQIDNYFKYKGNRAVKKSNFTFSSGGYESKDHAQKLRNGRRRSWTSAKSYDPNTGKTTDKTDYKARPSERYISRWGL